jgi:hypothetical protein
MNTRIRYSKLADGTLVSMRVITGADGKEYRSYILPTGVDGAIKEATKDEPLVAQVKGTSPHKVRIAIKATLQALGCRFAKESRGADA